MIAAISGLLLVPVFYVAVMYATYIDKTVTSGSAYGFTIGASKAETYSTAKNVFAKKNVFIIDPSDFRGYRPNLKMTFSQDQYAILSGDDHWRFYLKKGEYHSSINLRFLDDNLVEINRHRQYFELP